MFCDVFKLIYYDHRIPCALNHRKTYIKIFISPLLLTKLPSFLRCLSTPRPWPITSHNVSTLSSSVKCESGNFTPASSDWFSISCENAKKWPATLYVQDTSLVHAAQWFVESIWERWFFYGSLCLAIPGNNYLVCQTLNKNRGTKQKRVAPVGN